MPQLSPSRLPSAVLLLLVGLLLAPAPGSQGSEAPDAGLRAVAAVLESVPEDAPEATLVKALTALGPTHVGALFDVLHGESAAVLGKPLDPTRRAALESALLALPRDVLVKFLRGLASEEVEPAVRVRALELAGAFAKSGHLSLLGELASPGDEERLESALARGFQTAFRRSLERDPRILAEVTRLYGDTGSGLATVLLRCLGEAGSHESVRILGTLVGVRRPLDTFLLVHLKNGATRLAVEPTPRLRSELQRMLRENDVSRVTAAIGALGALRDDQVVGDLVTCLRRPGAGVVAPTVAALQRITGFGFGVDVETWERWYVAEERWWQERSEIVLDELERARGRAFTRAVVEALQRRTHRDRIARALARRLADRDPGEVVAACQALAQIRSRAALPELIDCIDAPSSEVREAARGTLAAILGIDAPPPGAVWADYLP